MPDQPDPTIIKDANAIVIVTPATVTVSEEAAKQLGTSLDPGAAAASGNAGSSEAADEAVTTSHAVTIGGQAVSYTATAGTLVLRADDGKPRAKVFYIAYTRDDVADVAKRPITFAFNGGPGSSSVWLHLGAFGPRRVRDAGRRRHAAAAVPPGRQRALAARPHRPGVHRPGHAPATAARCPARRRQEVPRLQGGHRVGRRVHPPLHHALRALGVAASSSPARATARRARRGWPGYLQDRHGMYLNGVMLVSSILNFQTAALRRRQRPAVLALPADLHRDGLVSQAPAGRAAAGDLGRDARRGRSASPLGEYAAALMQGDALPADERARSPRKLARLHRAARARVHRADQPAGRHQPLRQGAAARRAAHGRPPRQPLHRHRPRRGAASGPSTIRATPPSRAPYTAALNDYVRATLGFESDLPYEILTGRVRPWSYGDCENRYLERRRDAARRR